MTPRIRKLHTFPIDADLTIALKMIKSRDGISESEQIRRAVRHWVSDQLSVRERHDWSKRVWHAFVDDLAGSSETPVPEGLGLDFSGTRFNALSEKQYKTLSQVIRKLNVSVGPLEKAWRTIVDPGSK